jgi:hypothetical protein
MKVFMSFSFREEDRDLVDDLESLLRSHDVLPVTGRELDGEPITQAVTTKIDECDALVALMTRRDPIGNGTQQLWRTHDWVRDELNHARSRDKRAIALVELGVDLGGAYTENERIELDRDAPLRAFMALSQRLANWKRDMGRTAIAAIVPPELGHNMSDDPAWSCRYRFWSNGNPGNWVDGTFVPARGGTQLMLRGMQDDNALIEVQVRRDGTLAWKSLATSPYVTIELSEVGEQR